MSKDKTFQPEVWAVCDYSEGAGGYNAFMGVARHFAKESDLNLRTFDCDQGVYQEFRECIEEVVGNHYSSGQLRSFEANHSAVENFFLKNGGIPQAILTSFGVCLPHGTYDFNGETKITSPQQIFLAESLRLSTWKHYLPSEHIGLVPHSLTEEILTKEARHFYEILKSDGRPMVAIVMANNYRVKGSVLFKLNELVQQFPNARFVVLSSPRCTGADFQEFSNYFSRKLNPEQRANLITYTYGKDSVGKNPYKACLTLADHFILLGESFSMVSEILFAGRTVYYDGCSPINDIKTIYTPALLGNEKIKLFPNDAPLTTETFPPIDATRPIAERLLADYRSGKGFGA